MAFTFSDGCESHFDGGFNRIKAIPQNNIDNGIGDKAPIYHLCVYLEYIVLLR
jgi:hypothetical protein